MAENEEYEKKGSGVYQNYKKETGLFMGRFPKKLASEWEKDCQENYGGMRWMKAYSDHCKSRQLESEELISEMSQLKPQEVPQEQKEEEIKTFGGGK